MLMKRFIGILTLILPGFFQLSIAQVSLQPFPSGEIVTSENCLGGIANDGIRIVSNGTLSTATPGGVDISLDGEMTYVARNMIHLRAGFHAGGFDAGSTDGFFRTEFLSDNNFILVSPDPGAIIDDVVHVPKWEKLEIGFKLPSVYEFAISKFFEHYYDITPGNQVNLMTDINPYASDSLNVRVTLTSPSGRILTRYAFYMREATWGAAPLNSNGVLTPGAAELTADLSPLSDYHWRFRFAPDEVDPNIPWTMRIQVFGPLFTSFPEVDFGYFTFFCDPPLPDNHGFLHVNQDNNRYLRFDDGTDYLGIGINLGEGRKGFSPEESLRSQWFRMQKLDFDRMNEIISELAQNGGNEVRLSLNRGSFAFEWENLGVYDEYKTIQLCDPLLGNPNEIGWTGPYPNEGNRQFHAWAFDKILEACRANNVYVQLNLFLAVNYHAYQTYLWGDNAYYNNYVVGNPAPGGLLGWDTKRFFISTPLNSPGNSTMNTGSMYYWKRHFRYLMARWGYSTNIAWFETFNEIDCILRFRDEDFTGVDHMCQENRIDFPQETATRDYIKLWHQHLIQYVKDDLDNNEANVRTPNHLWSVSYANSDDGLITTDTSYFELYDLPEIDIIDLHSYDFPNGNSWPEINKRRFEIINGNNQGAQGFFGRFGKPCCFGEGSTYGKPIYVQNFDGTFKSDDRLTRIFQNYKMTFHNMIWSSALSGTCSIVKTWQWENVSWLEEGMPRPLREVGVNDQPTNILGGINTIQPFGAFSQTIPLPNIKLLDQFLPLRAFLSDFNPVSSTALKYYYNTVTHQEGIIHTNGNGVGGWLHHAAKYLDNSYYYTSSTITLTPPGGGAPIIIDPDEHYTDCQGLSPFANTLTLDPINTTGITDQTGMAYSTFVGQSNLPDVEVISVNQSKVLSLSNHPLTCTYENESVAFKAFSSGNRMKKTAASTSDNPCFDALPVEIVQLPDIIQVRRKEHATSDQLTGQDLTAYVSDVLGREVMVINQSVSEFNIDISSLKEGMYILTLINGICKTSRKFVKL